jgi:predicted Zn-dependent protease with MMP-like domain
MVIISDDDFQQLITEAHDALPGEHAKGIQNVALLYSEEPTAEQLTAGGVGPGMTLLGLYEGVSLPRRQGRTDYPPDRITLFKGPMTRRANTLEDLKEEVKHTLWHEIAHYYGLDHDRIHELE